MDSRSGEDGNLHPCLVCNRPMTFYYTTPKDGEWECDYCHEIFCPYCNRYFNVSTHDYYMGGKCTYCDSKYNPYQQYAEDYSDAWWECYWKQSEKSKEINNVH